jgi:hypothetical protein
MEPYARFIGGNGSRCYNAPVSEYETTAQHTATADDDDDFTYEKEGPPPAPQVSSYIAIIRIVSVLTMGVCMSGGIFLSLLGLRGMMIGIPLFLVAIPCYYGMQIAEKLANREANRQQPEED